MLNKYVTGNFRGVICNKSVKQKHNADVVASHLNVQLPNCQNGFRWHLALQVYIKMYQVN